MGSFSANNLNLGSKSIDRPGFFSDGFPYSVIYCKHLHGAIAFFIIVPAPDLLLLYYSIYLAIITNSCCILYIKCNILSRLFLELSQPYQVYVRCEIKQALKRVFRVMSFIFIFQLLTSHEPRNYFWNFLPKSGTKITKSLFWHFLVEFSSTCFHQKTVLTRSDVGDLVDLLVKLLKSILRSCPSKQISTAKEELLLHQSCYYIIVPEI